MKALGRFKSSKVALGNNVPNIPLPQDLNVDPTTAPYTGGQAAVDFLRNNVLVDQDIIPTVATGFTSFDSSSGIHRIPLSEVGKQFTNDGSLMVPDTQTLVVTDFRPYAAMPNPGLPGSYVEVDTMALVGQVTFYLVAHDGKRMFGEISLAQGKLQNGAVLLNESTANIPVLTDSTQSSLRAVYDVQHMPLPGYPAIVGVRIKGYMVSTQMLAEALSFSDR